ncbi:IPT/TIG domain-containing protein [Parafilimonas sp.]|uniref:IPT/TIG domain-containing protein n=1 Tax=Parafilimonas sp. TaxID=1969739 RepID=UPI0039E37C32
MKKIYNVRLLLLLGLVACTLMYACKKDTADTTSGETQLLSFGPSGSQPGDTIRFFGINLDKVTEIDFTGASVAGSDFVSQSKTEIYLIVPTSTEKGYVTLKTPDGDIVSKTVFDMEITPVISSMPSSAKPGDEITITGTYLNWVTSIVFADDVWVTDSQFVSQSFDKIVLTVPLQAKTGRLIFNSGGTEPLETESDAELVLTLPAITALSPNPVERGGTLTITGTDLDLVRGVLFKGVTDTVTAFTSQTEDKIEVTVPETANKGAVTIVSYSGVAIESEDALLLVGDLPDLDPLSYAFYDDAIENGWSNWGWGGAVDFANTENVRMGSAAIKKTYDGTWDALRFGGSSISTTGYTSVVFSIYGTAGTGGQKINVIFNQTWSAPQYVLTITEGEWQDVVLPVSDLGGLTEINDFIFQAQGWAGTIYVDYIGLR